jgi:hypothetical protein
MIHEKAPIKEGIITGKIPRDKSRFFPGSFTLATKKPIGTPTKSEKITTDILSTKEFMRLLWYRGEVINLLKFDRFKLPKFMALPEPIKARRKVIIIG